MQLLFDKSVAVSRQEIKPVLSLGKSHSTLKVNESSQNFSQENQFSIELIDFAQMNASIYF